MAIRCIYHAPYPITERTDAASAIRPRKMLEAFQRNFDEVFIISGYGKERKAKFAELKKRILKGIRYDFMYSENSTMPNLITEKNHMPYYPLLERDIFRFCHKQGIPTGLFYRDIFWKFPFYKEKVSFLKRCITIPAYHYDLAVYNRYINILYLASDKVGKYIDFKGMKKPLPPGSGVCTNDRKILEKEGSEVLELFYVGGVGSHYDLSKIIEGMKRCEYAHLTICCHKDQWDGWILGSKIEIPSNITVIHKSGQELEDYYKKADLGVVFFSSAGYWEMAMPVKLFEYIEHLLPVIATENCSVGDFVVKNNIGWTIKYQTEDFVRLLTYLNKNKSEIENKRPHLLKAVKENTWDARAFSIYYDLKQLREGRA